MAPFNCNFWISSPFNSPLGYLSQALACCLLPAVMLEGCPRLPISCMSSMDKQAWFDQLLLYNHERLSIKRNI